MGVYFLLLKKPSGQSIFRAIATIISLALATTIILLSVSIGQGWIERDQKADLAGSIFSESTYTGTPQEKDPIYVSTYSTEFDSKVINEIGIHISNKNETLPGGLKDTPKDEELWVTPGLKRLIDENPDLADRYSKYSVKPNFPHGLAPSPDSLMLMYTISDPTAHEKPDSFLQVYSAEGLRQFDQNLKKQREDNTILSLIIPLFAGILIIVPILLLITEIARIGMVQREKRYATLSLAGTTKKQIRTLTAIETIPLSILGSLLGCLIFATLILPLLASTQIGDTAIWYSDLALSPFVYVIVTMAVLFCSTLAGLYSLRLVKISPLAVTRTTNDVKKGSIFSMAFLVIGLAGVSIISFNYEEWVADNMEQAALVVAGFILLTLLGIFIAGPYLINKISTIFLLFARGGSTTLAAHRLRAVSRKTFHSISGVILALFVGSLFMTLLSTIQATETKYQGTYEKLDRDLNPLENPLHVSISLPSDSVTLIEKIDGDAELRNMVEESFIQQTYTAFEAPDEESDIPTGYYYESCEVYEKRTGLKCDKNIEPNTPFFTSLELRPPFDKSDVIFNPLDSLENGMLTDEMYVLVAKNKESVPDVVNKVYDHTSSHYIYHGVAVYVNFRITTANETIVSIKVMEKLVIIMLAIVMLIGSLSLVVKVIGSVFDRKRSFISLRILGASITALVKSLSIEIVVPLLTLSLFISGLGIYACYCLLSVFGLLRNDYMQFSLPDITLWLGIGFIIVLTVLVSLVNIPILSKIINFDEIRAE